MFMLYALLIGLAAGRVLGGRVGRLRDVRFDWAWLAIAALAVQLLLFSAPVTAVVGDLGPPLYVASTMLVLAVVLRNVRGDPGLTLVALGAILNLAAIVANGGYMPVTPEALASVGRLAPTDYSNSVVAAHPAFEVLIDRFALPPWLPLANVFSLGDVLITAGIALAMVVAMRRSPIGAPPRGLKVPANGAPPTGSLGDVAAP